MFHIDATNLGRYMNCNGSRLLDRPPLPESSDDTVRNEGNAFHWLVKEVFDGRMDSENAIGQQAYNGVFITAAMVEHCVEYINSIWPGEMEIRTTWGGINFQIDGRADHIGFNPNTLQLDVDDIKYGYGIIEPDYNWTLISHAIGYVKANSANIPTQINFTIYQPRAYHPLGSRRTWSISYDDLCGFAAQIEQTLTYPDDSLRTGLHCYKCPSMSVCPAYRMASMNAIDATSRAFTDNLSPEELAAELDLIELAANVINSRKKAIEELALYQVSNGKVVPGRIIDRPKGQTRYKSNVTPDMLTALIGVDIAEKKLPKISTLKDRRIPQMVIDAITERPEGAPKLVKVDANKLAQKMLKKGVN